MCEEFCAETRREDEITALGSVITRSEKGNIHCLTIIGQIEGHQLLPETSKTTKYEHVLPLLAAVEESEEIEGLLIMLNTVGGDIEAGLAIAELISGMKTPTASLILGGGHSIGVPLAVAAGRSFIAPSASMIVHPVRLSGVVIGVQQTYDYFARVQERIVQFVAANSRVDARRFTEYMTRTGELMSDVGSLLCGAEAVECGLIDQVGSLSDALEYLHSEIAALRAQKDAEGEKDTRKEKKTVL